MTTALHPTQRQRFRFIESLACWEGEVNRQRVCDAMEVTPNHLTRDFNVYRKLYPGNLYYDVSLRCYRPGTRFRPKLASGEPSEYLGLLQLHAQAVAGTILPGLPGPSSAELVARAPSQVDGATLQAITRGIARQHRVLVTYQSMQSPRPERRRLWPHALVFDGYRWHVRAYDEKKQVFGDFVLARMGDPSLEADATLPAEAKPARDAGWTEQVSIEVCPAPKLSPAQAAAVAREYGMVRRKGEWVWEATMRRCLAPYFLRFHPLDPKLSRRLVALKNPALFKRHDFTDAT